MGGDKAGLRHNVAILALRDWQAASFYIRRSSAPFTAPGDQMCRWSRSIILKILLKKNACLQSPSKLVVHQLLAINLCHGV